MIIGIGHKMRQGKDTVADYLVEKYNFVKLSFGSFLKLEVYGEKFPVIYYNKSFDKMLISCYYTNDIYLLYKNHPLYGELYDRIKKYLINNYDFFINDLYVKLALSPGEKDRELLQIWGDYRRTTVGKYYFVNKVEEKIRYFGNFDIVVSDVRYKNEAEMIRKHGGILLDIYGRPINESEKLQSHSSEVELDDYGFDYRIKNDSSFEDLYKEVDEFVKWARKMTS